MIFKFNDTEETIINFEQFIFRYTTMDTDLDNYIKITFL